LSLISITTHFIYTLFFYRCEVKQSYGKKALRASSQSKVESKKPKALVAIESYH